MTGRDHLLQLACFLWVGLQAGHDVHPVECMQVVEVHRVVVHLQGLGHDLAYEVGVVRNLDVQRVFHCAHASQRVATGADATDTLDESPGIARIAPLENYLQPTPHGAGRNCVANYVVAVEIDLAAHVTLDAGDRIDDDATPGVVHRKALSLVCTHDLVLVLRQAVLQAGVWVLALSLDLSRTRLATETAA